MQFNTFMSYKTTTYSSVIIFVSAVIVASLFFLDHILKIPVCPLCFIQRPSWYIILIVLPLNFLIKSRLQLFINTSIVSLLLLFTMSYGIFQAGAEWKLWQGLASCGNIQQDIKNFIIPNISNSNLLQLPDYIPCSTDPWRFLGISFAGYNVLISLGLLIICFLIFNNIRKLKR